MNAITPSYSLTDKTKDKKNSSKAHKTADTSIECYHTIFKEGQISREAEIVLQLIADQQPITSRRISYLTKIERTNITRSLFDLTAQGKVKYPFTAKCPVTNKRVRFYTLIDWKEADLAS